jgi:hypothetical protein
MARLALIVTIFIAATAGGVANPKATAGTWSLSPADRHLGIFSIKII